MQPKNILRLLRALARQGLDVQYNHQSYSVRWSDSCDTPIAEVLLPEDFPVEVKALKQLANLATVKHPAGGWVSRICATPDFHPGDAGVAIGSVVETSRQVIPAAVGSDINCGMRLHVADLSVEQFLAQRDRFVELVKGDFFFGKRDVTMTAQAMQALFQYGTIGWLDTMLDQPTGTIVQSDLNQLASEIDRIFLQGSMTGHLRWAPEELVPDTGQVRDGGLATIGGGNHFVEVQWIDRIEDRQLAYQWGVREGQLAFMVHSGSRNVGKYIGGIWRDLAQALWREDLKYPKSRLFPLSSTAHPEVVADYLQAEATAANYAFVNRLLLAELLRLRLRQVYGDLDIPLVYDLPHNITLSEGQGWVTRKGACPAHVGQPVIIPGSMGTPSYLLVGLGNHDWCCSASHGAGRARSRFDLNRKGNQESEDELGLTGVDCITLREERRIEEAPAAYKPIAPVIDAQVQAGLVQVVARMHPILTFKA
ncbi:RtcB family protein [Roseofilum reptotaenium CS-1145]|uniref:tRNA-splicing ligase RtcB n=1 Tax=Roseofilum reptotaenium AO1-A TaxID=1925591 RepID=A0A1L9QMN5_9CYAN|nr:RtcB family protein [Roseofilum reptotaenium]MDB9517633.1 RtcB family protein [Roseofilum reptotaenium CS-1145]OJJ22697.1 RNA-splicing ligase RtcB [Roseofilum reptotaenium AO1-A]